ncbi:ribonuclease J [Spiroplasma endosymbiont of Aspidapion aeneum]|uniref:ribonuclease J n=1 Tax=Spiroplasma endosymbiont of Aspidapion aeneum TaxID=3066276 RepID=UPI00313E2241
MEEKEILIESTPKNLSLVQRIEVVKLEDNLEPPKKKYKKAPFPTKVFALGGLEEVGKNTYCIEYDDELIMIDSGIKFPDSSELGVSAIIPSFNYLVENNKKVKALFITHGHEDHIGGIPYLLQQVTIPVIYAPRFAAALIIDRIKEFRLQNKTTVREYKENDVYSTKHFSVTFAALNHSIPDAFGILVDTPNGSIFSTGDFKFDWTPLGNKANVQRLARIGNDGVELLMSDSTNAEVEGYTVGEQSIISNIEAIFLKTSGRIFIATFASNAHRIQHIMLLAKKYSKKIVVFGRALERLIKISRQLGDFKLDDKMFIKPSEISLFPQNQLLFICTGAQGEPNAALTRISRNEHQNVFLSQGDTIIMSASPIPGNRASVESVINKLTKRGAVVYDNSTDKKVHTSGHASQEEQKLLFSLLKPKFFMPMHGEYRMLKTHGETAVKVNVKPNNVFIVSNGDQINIQNGEASINERVDADAVYIDGKDLTKKAGNIMKERTILSKKGLIGVIVSIDSQENKLWGAPRIITRGCFYAKDNTKLIADSIQIVIAAVNNVLSMPKPTFAAIKKNIWSSLSTFIFKHKRINPLIIPVILNKK